MKKEFLCELSIFIIGVIAIIGILLYCIFRYSKNNKKEKKRMLLEELRSVYFIDVFYDKFSHIGDYDTDLYMFLHSIDSDIKTIVSSMIDENDDLLLSNDKLNTILENEYKDVEINIHYCPSILQKKDKSKIITIDVEDKKNLSYEEFLDYMTDFYHENNEYENLPNFY